MLTKDEAILLKSLLEKHTEPQPEGPKGRYVIVRSRSAGVFAGYYDGDLKDQVVTLRNVRRIFYWSGAASLSQLALEGTANPKDCKFSVVVPSQQILEVIEILDTTTTAKQNIEKVPVWKV